jgi:hypothetical protein
LETFFRGEYVMKQQLRALGALAAVAILLVTLGSSNAFARGDGKSYAGASCQPVTPADVDRVAYYSGIAYNTSTTDSLVLQCPIIRDTENGIDDGGAAVLNRHFNAVVDCTMRSFSAPDGGPHRQVAESRELAPWDPDVQHLVFSGVRAPGPFGYYTMDCVVPPAVNTTEAGWSGIVFYWVSEREH